MKIVNKTSWRDDHVRAIVKTIARAELSPSNRKAIVVEIVPSKGNGSSGLAWIKKKIIRVRVRTTVSHLGGDDRLDFASTIAHEMHHIETGRAGRSWEYHKRRSVRYGRPRTIEGKLEKLKLYWWILGAPLSKRGCEPPPGMRELSLVLSGGDLKKSAASPHGDSTTRNDKGGL